MKITEVRLRQGWRYGKLSEDLSEAEIIDVVISFTLQGGEVKTYDITTEDLFQLLENYKQVKLDSRGKG